MLRFALLLCIFMAFVGEKTCAGPVGKEPANQWGEGMALGRIFITGDTSLTITANQPFTSSAMDDAIERLIAALQDQGYYYCQARAVNMSSHSDTVDVTVSLKRGPLVTIGELICEGLVRNSSHAIGRYLAIQPGAPLTTGTISRVEARARQIPYLSFEPPLTVTPRPGYNQADLRLRFREPSAVSLQGNAGYRADDHNGLVWSFEGMVRDLFGEGRRIRLRSERRDKFQNSLAIEYRQPVYWFGVSELAAELRTRDYRNQFTEFAASAGLSARLGDRSTLGSTLEWTRVDPVTGLIGYSRYLARIDFGLSTVVDTVNPRSGNFLHWSVGYAYRQYRSTKDTAGSVQSSLNETRSQFTMGRYQPIGPAFVGLATINLKMLTTPEDFPPVSELYFIGGPGTIRGYRSDQFSARRSVFGGVELRWRGAAGYLFGFCDAAYIVQPLTRPSGVSTDEHTKIGYGIGANLIDRDRSVMLAFAWNPEIRFSAPRLILSVATGL
jgi:outer membrane protein assembly factor BamA